ncbi:hypothetical protein RJ639_012128 [Escallonia herrerae]|uniref:RNase H type-1 domain-containing protein n=1 Tax=Escallonia herrerae TaxID=1293975 RepID=A0AA89ASV0_9ASTE|nr:hypothetical protein RJ639_012128 [Escallonia herrerae]
MRSLANKRNKDLRCHFHNDYGHTTDNCGSLKRAIETLIKHGQLRKFIAHKEGQHPTPLDIEEREEREENADVNTPHDNPLVIAIKAGNFNVKRVLKMNIPTDRLQKMDTSLYGFSNHPVTVESVIALPVAIGGGINLPPQDEVPHRALDWGGERRSEYGSSVLHDSQKLFEELKAYLGSPPLLSKPLPGEDLFLYLSITEVAVSTVLVREEDEVQKPIYYVSSNNEVEYEAFLAGIWLAHTLRVDSLSVYSDSQLVVNHVLGDYEARDERMAQYLQLVKTLASKFKNFTIRQIPRDQNTQADTLSRLSSAEVTNV